MLMLARKVGEWIVVEIGGQKLEIVVHELNARNHRVRLGFDGPDEVRVMRKEILERVTPVSGDDKQ